MNDEEFEKHYEEFLKKNKRNISYKLWEEENNVRIDFSRFFDEHSIFSRIFGPVFILGGIGFVLIPKDGYVVLNIISGVIWIGLTVWSWCNVENIKDMICNYIFYKYHRDKIIEKYVRNKASEALQDNKNMFDFWEEKYFYDKCIEQLKYEDFETRS